MVKPLKTKEIQIDKRGKCCSMIELLNLISKKNAFDLKRIGQVN